VEGENFHLEHIHTNFDTSRVGTMAKHLVEERVDAIWVSDTATAVAAVRATRTIPIVLAGACAYPVECGVIKSFAHPGGNVTGVAWGNGIEVQSKLVQFARETLPSAKKLAWIAIPPDLVTVAGGVFRPEGYYRQVAHSMGFELGYFECSKAEDFEPAFRALQSWGAEAVVIEPSPLSADGMARPIADLAMQIRIPSFFNVPFNAQAGGLLAYGPNYYNVMDLTVGYVDRILRGAHPADMPVEMPNKLDLVVNRKTARVLGITLPQPVLLRADQVIE
jgi:ABC-type uncharacterized transport system substrate-binding protein